MFLRGTVGEPEILEPRIAGAAGMGRAHVTLGRQATPSAPALPRPQALAGFRRFHSHGPRSLFPPTHQRVTSGLAISRPTPLFCRIYSFPLPQAPPLPKSSPNPKALDAGLTTPPLPLVRSPACSHGPTSPHSFGYYSLPTPLSSLANPAHL